MSMIDEFGKGALDVFGEAGWDSQLLYIWSHLKKNAL
jgi:hypothetical protein